MLTLENCHVCLGYGARGELKAFLADHLQKGTRIFLLTDKNTHLCCLPLVRDFLPEGFVEYTIAPGEESKSLREAEAMWRWLDTCNAGRNDLLINLGGGVVSDLGGFVASAFKRGMNYLNIPTSLIAMADAATGGKTAVNLDGVKNQVGSFYFPHGVIIDPVFLQTLPADHIRSGYAEILKSALIAGKEAWQMATKVKWEDVEDWMPLLDMSIRLKTKVVSKDPGEEGYRRVLNFGHTLGHAFESVSKKIYPPGLLHGDAVALGMIAELFISWRKGKLDRADMNRISSHLRKVFPAPPFSIQDKDSILDFILKDKKNRANLLVVVLLKEIGAMEWDSYCDIEVVKQSIDHVIKDM